MLEFQLCARRGGEGFWVGGEWTGTSWEWNDLSAWTYSNWNDGEPNNWESGTEDCLEVYTNGKWNDEVNEISNNPISGHSSQPYVCQYLDINQFSS